LFLGGSGPTLLLEANGISSLAGALRIGELGREGTLLLPFDTVAIAHIAVSPESPGDLVLQVTSARTGAAVLSCEAVFANIFAAPSGKAAPSTLQMELQWTSFGGALGRGF